MIDAYTIGIKLALDDGVSAGIASVRRDLATLDRAIAFTADGLVALRRIGKEISAVGPVVVNRAPSPVAPAQVLSKSQTLGQPGPLSSNLGNAARPQPDPVPRPEVRSAVTPAAPSMDPEPLLMRRANPPQGSGRAAPSAPRQSSISSTPRDLPPPPSPTPPDRYPAAAISAPRAKSVVEFAPRLPDQQRVGAEALSSRLPPTPISFPPDAAPQSLGSSLARDVVSIPSPAEPTSRTEMPAVPRARSDATVLPPVFTSSASTGAKSAAPRADTRLARTSREVNPEGFTENPSFTERPRPQMRHQSTDHEPGQSGASGDITLDGTRLGRWMADALARFGERPPSGSTGLDPRVTPDWPTMQGH